MNDIDDNDLYRELLSHISSNRGEFLYLACLEDIEIDSGIEVTYHEREHVYRLHFTTNSRLNTFFLYIVNKEKYSLYPDQQPVSRRYVVPYGGSTYNLLMDCLNVEKL